MAPLNGAISFIWVGNWPHTLSFSYAPAPHPSKSLSLPSPDHMVTFRSHKPHPCHTVGSQMSYYWDRSVSEFHLVSSRLREGPTTAAVSCEGKESSRKKELTRRQTRKWKRWEHSVTSASEEWVPRCSRTLSPVWKWNMGSVSAGNLTDLQVRSSYRVCFSSPSFPWTTEKLTATQKLLLT